MSMLMRSAAMRRANANTNQGFLRGAAVQEEAPRAIKAIDALDEVDEADRIVKRMKFKVTCGIKSTGQVMFFAQLKGGKSFFTTPVMPKDPYGNPLTPENVANGATGYITLIVSANANIAEDAKGQNEFTIRPEFGAFDLDEESSKKSEAALAAKVANEAKQAKQAK